ncbi:hypothetical protein CSV72_01985 [Sporosarcina sp. P20a]|uniref:ImmA/IrrE family metallo-endopeptidase n=1 Tax=Sporosarcina sp. P20a TaxID=2048256 RepID=UPI000C16870B|nr:ImmA/IrrE family metallo-endopeptidase [Sporosarcina sp. P20a]PIC87941.1 hypothetical protein CSV72_01985 [Sporosarcina sp. P20a]
MYVNSHLEDYIENLYTGLSINNPAQLNEYVIADRLDIRIYLASDPSEAFYWQEQYYIFINRDLDSQQRWQDFGHELCHILRHSGHQGHMTPPFRELQEWQADNFMYHFCIPTFMLKHIRLPPDQQAAAYVITQFFNVELKFAEERLNRYLRKQFTGGFQVEEQIDTY